MADVTDRMRKLQAMLQREPEDVFLLYALAVEHKNAGDHAAALDYLAQVTARDPGHCAAYQQAGEVHALAGDVESARRTYQAGIRAARDKGDLHAAQEMQAALTLIQ